MTDISKQEPTKLQQATEKPVFKPTPHMLVWLDTQTTLQTDVVDEIARQSGIDESSWYRWLKEDGFEDWYWEQYDKRIRRWKPMVDAIGVKFARKGSEKHFEYLAKRTGNITDKAVSTTVPVQINNFIKNEKDEFGI